MLWVVDTCWKAFLTFKLLCSPLTRNKGSLLTVQEWEVVFFSFYYFAGCATVAKENERKSYLLQALDGVETQDLHGELFRKGQQRCKMHLWLGEFGQVSIRMKIVGLLQDKYVQCNYWTLKDAKGKREKETLAFRVMHLETFFSS